MEAKQGDAQPGVQFSSQAPSGERNAACPLMTGHAQNVSHRFLEPEPD